MCHVVNAKYPVVHYNEHDVIIGIKVFEKRFKPAFLPQHRTDYEKVEHLPGMVEITARSKHQEIEFMFKNKHVRSQNTYPLGAHVYVPKKNEFEKILNTEGAVIVAVPLKNITFVDSYRTISSTKIFVPTQVKDIDKILDDLGIKRKRLILKRNLRNLLEIMSL